MIRALVLFAALLCTATPGSALAEHHEAAEAAAAPAELTAWDQEAVSAQARDLQKTCEKLRNLERRMPSDTIASGQAAARNRYRDLLRQLTDESRQLADLVGKGESREASEKVYDRLQVSARNAAEEARRMFLSVETLDEIKKAEAQLNQLRLYYKGAPDPRPALGPDRTEE